MMKNVLLFIPLFCITNGIFAQIGINTTAPTATLDVNGTFKIRSTIKEVDIGVIRDSILVISKTGIVNTVPAPDIINVALPTVVKASFTGTGNINHLLSIGSSKIMFDDIEVDNNNEFDPATNTFTAKQDGIYAINAQVKLNAVIGVSTDFGLGIYKNNVLIAEHRFTSIVVLTVQVSSPIRYVSTTVDLVATDTIEFRVTSTLPNVDILGSDTESYCSIYQLR
ncbi:hypothetical protein AAFN75_00765 [Algibacter sp. AS12]|uniref:hypothetical protein n=1 Tax=Algibacter sp. AS12 TaxID=3135773 RepID=UPI00398A6042